MQAGSIPMYKRIYEAVKEQIRNGIYETGQRVPSEKELAAEFGVSRITSKKALQLLVEDRLIFRQPGRGSFVSGGSQEPVSHLLFNGEEERPSQDKKVLLGFIITDFDYSFGTELIKGIDLACKEHGCFYTMRRSFGVPANEEVIIKEFLDLGVDGILVLPAQGEFYSEEILRLVINRFPLVIVDRQLKKVAATCVSTNNIAAAKLAAEYLMDLGHRHIGLLSPPPIGSSSIEDRLEGFRRAHVDRGMQMEEELSILGLTGTLSALNRSSGNPIQRDIQLIQEHLIQNPRLTAYFALEYDIALRAKAAIEQLHLSVPEDISIICFDSPPDTYGNGFCFAHIRQNEEEMGRLAVDYTLKLLKGEKVANKTALDASLIIGNSTSKVRKVENLA